LTDCNLNGIVKIDRREIIMPRYLVQVQERHTVDVRVTAESELDAVNRVLEGMEDMKEAIYSFTLPSDQWIVEKES
jgi:hypothetical protein